MSISRTFKGENETKRSADYDDDDGDDDEAKKEIKQETFSPNSSIRKGRERE